MKIVFNDSELSKGIINVSLNGGFTYKNYEITDVKESGIPLDDSQDYEKIKIKGPANTLKRLDIISTISSDGESPEGFNFIIDKDTYGPSFPECIVGITLPDGITSISDYSGSIKNIWLCSEKILVLKQKTFFKNQNFKLDNHKIKYYIKIVR